MIEKLFSSGFQRFILCSGCVLVALAVMGLVGCDTGGGTEGLEVTPATATLTGTNATVLLTVAEASLRELSLPLEWHVANPSLGSIVGATGFNATYVRTGRTGVNAVTVRDQFGAEGSVSIEQQ